MSAFIVSNEHISAMIQVAPERYPGDGAWYYWNEARHPISGNHQVLGQKLVDENYRSVCYYLGVEIVSSEFKSTPVSHDYTPVEIIKAIDCYCYQSCEAPNWDQSEAYAIVDTLRNRAIGRLPGYDEAAWIIPDGGVK